MSVDIRGRWRLRAATSAVAATLALTGIAASESQAKPSREFFGVVATSVQSEDLPRMKSNGVGTLRILLYWPAVQAGLLSGYDWGVYDGIIAKAAEQGVRVMPTLYGTPGWALAGREGCTATCAPTGAGITAFAEFARAAAARYGPGGELWRSGAPAANPLPVTRWQVWNEENSPKYFQPRPSPQLYAEIVGAVGGAIRSVDPAAEIILGGMWGPPRTKAVIPTTAYLRRFYSVPSVEHTFDSIGVHPYAPRLSGVTSQLKRVRKVVRREDPGAGMWITELGWASGGPRASGLVKSPRGQARLLKESFRALIAKRRAWNVRGITWYAWRDAGPGESDCIWCPQAGLRTFDGGLKPAARAFRRLALRRG